MNTINTFAIAVVITTVVQVVRFFFRISGRDITGNLAFVISILTTLVATLAAGRLTELNAFEQQLGAIFAATQTIYATAKNLWRMFRSFTANLPRG